MSSPDHLVMVSRNERLELFSAHYTMEGARLMHERLASLTKGTGARVHVVKVPETEGVCGIDGVVTFTSKHEQPEAGSQPDGVKWVPASGTDYDGETARMLQDADEGGVTDTPVPRYAGAFS